MKSKNNPFCSTAISGASIVFACFSLLNGGANADELWKGSAGDHGAGTGSNWVSGTAALASWSPYVFGSDVVNGIVDLPHWVAISSLTVNSGCTQPITINGGPIIMGGSLVDMSNAAVDLTTTSQLQQAWGDMTFNIGSGRTYTAAGGVGEAGWFGLHTGLTKNGAGTMVLGGPLNYTLGTTVNGGKLAMPDGDWTINNPWNEGSPRITTKTLVQCFSGTSSIRVNQSVC